MKEKLYNEILEMIKECNLKPYHRTLLATMIYRKVRHPLEKTDEILRKVTEKVIPYLYEEQKGKTWLRLSADKEMQNLEEALHDCTLPEDSLYQGYIIANVVKYYAKRMMDQ